MLQTKNIMEFYILFESAKKIINKISKSVTKTHKNICQKLCFFVFGSINFKDIQQILYVIKSQKVSGTSDSLSPAHSLRPLPRSKKLFPCPTGRE